jgi:SNF2 family DNA or RNA helicase
VTVQLFDHQKEGIAFLTGKQHGLLAFEQGLGKTLVAIRAFTEVLHRNECDRMLVICPNSLKRNWVAEIERFADGLTCEIAEGTPSRRKAVFAESRARVLITSYETARTEHRAITAFLQRQRTALTLDESHATKNWKSLTSTAARYFAPYARFRWLLSGTPVTNKAADLYTQFEIMTPGRNALGTLEAFVAQAEKDPSADFARDEIDRFVLRRTKEQCLDLPEKLFADIRVELPSWQRRLYDEMRDEMVCRIQAMSGDEYRAFAATALVQLTRLSQIASNPALVFPVVEGVPAKFDLIDNLLADVLSVPGRKVIIWSNYVASIEALLERLAAYSPVALYGGTPGHERQDIANRFQEDPDTRVLVANPAAAGSGFTLTAANYTIYETLSWRYDHYAQSQDRNHRIGQDAPVTYMRLIAADTIDEAIIRALERKSGLARALLGDEDGAVLVSSLTKDEMCALIIGNELPAEV